MCFRMATNVSVLRRNKHEYELTINIRSAWIGRNRRFGAKIFALDQTRFTNFQKLPVYAFELSKITNNENTGSIRYLRTSHLRIYDRIHRANASWRHKAQSRPFRARFVSALFLRFQKLPVYELVLRKITNNENARAIRYLRTFLFAYLPSERVTRSYSFEVDLLVSTSCRHLSHLVGDGTKAATSHWYRAIRLVTRVNSHLIKTQRGIWKYKIVSWNIANAQYILNL